MAETIKKTKTAAKAAKAPAAKAIAAKSPAAKAPAKARKAPAKKAAILTMASPKPVSHDEVAKLAHQFWSERGFQHGHHEEDWHRAEEMLRGKAS